MGWKDVFAEIKIKISTGQGWFYELRNALVIGASFKIIVELSIFETIILSLLVMLGFYLVGHFDLSKIKLSQKIQEITTRKYNPVFESWDNKINGATIIK